MYIPDSFDITDHNQLFEFIAANSFGQLVSTVEGRHFSSHIPFMVDEKKRLLISHMAKDNPQWNCMAGQEVLVTFQEPHDYISPTWYASPGVPTWNYQAVHIYGTAKILTEKDAITAILDDLTSCHESAYSTPWKPEYSDKLLNHIVGIHIEISEIQGKFKLSQNRSDIDRHQVIRKLQAHGSAQLAAAMQKAL